jgi:hypothetical protein
VEVVSALGVASAILVVAKFSAELLSTSIKSEKDSSLVQIGEYLENSPDRIRTLRDDLSTINGYTVRAASLTALKPSDDTIALQEIALFCIEDTGKLLENVENILRDFTESRSSELPRF